MHKQTQEQKANDVTFILLLTNNIIKFGTIHFQKAKKCK